MKLPPRIVLPILGSLLVTAGILGYLWWQITQSTGRIEQKIQAQTQAASRTVDSPSADPTFDTTGDRSLLALRQGDILALQGDWKEAQAQYQISVQEGGGIPALKKLAEAQLQRRDTPGLQSTLFRLKQQGAKAEDLLLLTSLINLRSGDFVKANTELTAAADSPQKAYGLALLHIIQGNHDQAKKDLAVVESGWDPVLRSYAKELLGAYSEYALFPDSPDIHLITLLSRAMAETHECELALPLLHQVVLKQDDYRDAWIVQGFCQFQTERYDDALASLERAYNLDPEKPETQYFLARTHSALNDHSNAITFGQYALQNGFQPEKEVRRFLAQEGQLIGNTALSLQQELAMSQLPDADLETFAETITLALSMNRQSDAQAVANQAVQKWPKEGRAYELLGLVQESMGQTDQAKSSYQQAVSLDPSLQNAQEKLAKMR